MFSLSNLLSIWLLLASLAIIFLKCLHKPIAAWPFPVAQSQTRSWLGVMPDKNANRPTGYTGLENEYSLDLDEKLSINPLAMHCLPGVIFFAFKYVFLTFVHGNYPYVISPQQSAKAKQFHARKMRQLSPNSMGSWKTMTHQKDTKTTTTCILQVSFRGHLIQKQFFP